MLDGTPKLLYSSTPFSKRFPLWATTTTLLLGGGLVDAGSVPRHFLDQEENELGVKKAAAGKESTTKYAFFARANVPGVQRRSDGKGWIRQDLSDRLTPWSRLPAFFIASWLVDYPPKVEGRRHWQSPCCLFSSVASLCVPGHTRAHTQRTAPPSPPPARQLGVHSVGLPLARVLLLEAMLWLEWSAFTTLLRIVFNEGGR